MHGNKVVGGVRTGAAMGVLDAMSQLAWTIAPDGHIDWLNCAWYAYTGRTPPGPGSLTSPGRLFAEGVHPSDLGAARRRLLEGMAGSEPFSFELRLKRADGINRWFSVHAFPLTAAQGATAAEWLAICTDIDDHKRQGQRFAFIAQAGEVLAESLDLQTTLERMLAIIVPDFGDWAAIDLFDENGRLKTVAAIAAAARRTMLVRRLVGRYTHNPDAEPRIAAELRKNQPVIIPEVDATLIERAAAPDLLDVLRALAPRSAITIPLRTRGGTIGSLVAFWSETPRRYSEDDLPLFEELTKRAAVAIENARLYEREREVATEFQRAALPISLPDVPGIHFDGIYVPASKHELLGGDWYDALRLSDGRIVVSIGDVAGSGLPAAVIMSSMRQVIRGVAQVYPDPTAMLDAADKTLKTEYPDTFVTAFVGVLDPVTRTFTYASAGHPQPMLRAPDGTVTALGEPGPPLGLRLRGETATSVQLPESAFLVFYSDGLIEAGHDVLDGQRRLVNALSRSDVVTRSYPAEAIYRTVLDGNSADDVVILTIQLGLRTDSGGLEPDEDVDRRWTFDTSDAETAYAARHAFVAALRSRGVQHEELDTAELIFGELLGNVVRYAPGPIEIMVDWNSAAPVLHVLDRGPGFTLVPRLPSDLLSERGRGLYIVWALAEDFNVTERFDGGSHARAVLGTRSAIAVSS